MLDKHVPSLSNYMRSFIFPCHTAGGVLVAVVSSHSTSYMSNIDHPNSKPQVVKQELRLFQDNHQELSLMDLIDMISQMLTFAKSMQNQAKLTLSYFKILEITCCDKSEGFRNMQRITISITAWECANARFLYTVILRWQVAP